MHKLAPRFLIVAALIALFGLQSAVPSVQAAPNNQQEKVKVFLSNSFVGNDWRVEMENVAAAVAKKSAVQ